MWSGTWVAERLGVELVGDEELRSCWAWRCAATPSGPICWSRTSWASTCRSRRPWSTAPASTSVCGCASCSATTGRGRAVVLGYAETATGLGHSVADGLGLAPYLHSTRRPVAGVARAGGFEESHSHATSHLLLPEDPRCSRATVRWSSSTTSSPRATRSSTPIRALHERYPREHYVVVALVDMRSADDRGRLDEFAREIGARVDLVASASGTVKLPDGVLAKGQALVATTSPSPRPRRRAPSRAASRAPSPAA